MWAVAGVASNTLLSGQRGNRTPERRCRADLQSASFDHLDICPRTINNVQCSIAEPTARIELATLRLQGGRSAAELRRRVDTCPTQAARATTSSPLPRNYTHKGHSGQDMLKSPADANCTRDRKGCQRQLHIDRAFSGVGSSIECVQRLSHRVLAKHLRVAMGRPRPRGR